MTESVVSLALPKRDKPSKIVLTAPQCICASRFPQDLSNFLFQHLDEMEGFCMFGRLFCR